MLRFLSSRVLWGAMLVLGGLALLLQNLNVFRPAGSIFWAVVFLLAGVAFLSVYFENHLHWWAFIPAFTLLGLSLSSLLDVFSLALPFDLGGTLFLLGISIGFWAVFAVNRRQWWAIIPAGVLATLAVVSVIDTGNIGIDSGAIFFLGIGVTFGLLAVLPGYEGMLRWAYIPAGILVLIGLLVSASSSSMINLIIPALLIIAGVVVVGRNVVMRKG